MGVRRAMYWKRTCNITKLITGSAVSGGSATHWTRFDVDQSKPLDHSQSHSATNEATHLPHCELVFKSTIMFTLLQTSARPLRWLAAPINFRSAPTGCPSCICIPPCPTSNFKSLPGLQLHAHSACPSTDFDSAHQYCSWKRYASSTCKKNGQP